MAVRALATGSGTDQLGAAAHIRRYFAGLPPGSRKRLKELRDLIRAAAPRATESFGYGIPGFRMHGKLFISYAAWKNHVSMYPLNATFLRENRAAIAKFEIGKGTIRFPITDALPKTLVTRLVKARLAAANALAAKAK